MRIYDFKDKRIALLGFGKSNSELLKYIKKFTDDIHVFDQRAQNIPSGYENSGIIFHLGSDAFHELDGFDYIFRSPAIRPDNENIIREIQRGAVLTSEIEVFISLCKGWIIAVTGSDGKTTTSSMIYHILKKDGKKVFLGGNIGTPLITLLDDIDRDTYIVLELSSFQLMTLDEPVDVAVITNISPNHLDYHKSYDEYVESKKNLIRNLAKGCTVVLNAACRDSKRYFKSKDLEIRWFNSPKGAEYRDKKIYFNGYDTVDVSGIRVKGRHNIDNFMAAALAVIDIVSPDSIINTLEAFKGVEHRMEHVANINGVEYINDSIASSPSRTIAGLRSFDKKVILIAGGRDKGISYDCIGRIIKKHVKYLILTGETKDVILKSVLLVKKDMEYRICADLSEAVSTAYETAKEGDTVFFSPASTSFDAYENFEKRGWAFKDYVNRLKGDEI